MTPAEFFENRACPVCGSTWLREDYGRAWRLECKQCGAKFPAPLVRFRDWLRWKMKR